MLTKTENQLQAKTQIYCALSFLLMYQTFELNYTSAEKQHHYLLRGKKQNQLTVVSGIYTTLVYNWAPLRVMNICSLTHASHCQCRVVV
jgi:hypothetical protein